MAGVTKALRSRALFSSEICLAYWKSTGVGGAANGCSSSREASTLADMETPNGMGGSIAFLLRMEPVCLPSATLPRALLGLPTAEGSGPTRESVGHAAKE